MHSHNEEAKFMADLKEVVPEMTSAFFGFDKAVFNKNTGSLDLATRELIAVGVAVTTQCPFCIEDHAKRAIKAGASPRAISPKQSWWLRRCVPAGESPMGGRQ